MKTSDDHKDGDKNMKFDAIVDYQMNELETRAYTLSLILYRARTEILSREKNAQWVQRVQK